MSDAALRLFNRYFGDLRERMDPTTGPSGDPSPRGDEAQPRGLVLRPALLGFVAMVAIAIGASLPSSPFKLELPGVWFFGVPGTSYPEHLGPLLHPGRRLRRAVAVDAGVVGDDPRSTPAARAFPSSG